MTKPIWKVFEDIKRDVPEEELAKISPAENLECWTIGAEQWIPLGAPPQPADIAETPAFCLICQLWTAKNIRGKRICLNCGITPS